MPGGRRLSLAEVGLSADADLVWRVLLRTPDLPPAELSHKAGLSLAAAAAGVDELAAAGFLQRAAVPLGWAPVEPSMAVEQHIAVEQRELADRLAALSAMRFDLPELTADFSRGRERVAPRSEMQVLEGIDAIRGWLAMACANVKSETLSMQTALTTEGREAARPVDVAVLGRGVPGWTLVDAATLEQPENLAYFEQLSAAGENIRAVQAVPTRMAIFDREVAILPVDAADVKRAAVVVRTRTIVDSLVFLFERMWADAAPLFGRSDVVDRPQGRPARVLELLAMGRKDESIARALGIGVRTVRRDIAAVMTALGEKTRPATVAAAIRHGWLTAEPAHSFATTLAERHEPA